MSFRRALKGNEKKDDGKGRYIKALDCPCVKAEQPLCHPKCWHFGFHTYRCKNCGEGMEW